MINKFIIVLLICGVFWGLIRHKNHPSPSIKLESPQKITNINIKEIKSIASTVSEIKIIANENAQPKGALPVEVEHRLVPHTPDINFTWNDQKLIPITADEHHTMIAKSKKIFPPDAVWNGRKFIITTTVKNYAEIVQRKPYFPADSIKNELKQQNQSDQNDTSTEPDKVHCPSVEMIKQTAQQINEAFLYEGTYRIVSYEPVLQYSDVNWLVGVRGIVAGSSDEAIYLAGKSISETSAHKNEYAEIMDGPYTLFACYYSLGDIVALGIWDKVTVEE